ncbi:DUF4386 family protein [Paenibacillus filicis]|uniref:DUF4386 family protein n=1 Tax=Paenibacillus gyeongsangnamensis TaxID=3388067 RepID=A0ABT4Q8L7_9BACL|nr:DUF4386 family protein [Paenibacillus filicis]MCZ8513164.1 DUF4386 family protein [Paenibacillus filicis]
MAKAQGNEKDALFNSVFAVRQIEIGLASIASLLFGITVMIYGFALMKDPRFPKWLGILALAGGVPTAIAGIVMAYTGFSELDMAINMPANILLLCWMILLGIYMWRNPSLSFNKDRK